MKKLKVLINKKRLHFWNRVTKRNGKLKWVLYFILARCVETRGDTQIYRYRKIVFFVTNNQLQTYINKNISRKAEKLTKLNK